MHKVLVADDHLEIRKLIRNTLMRGLDMLEAENGEMALEIIRRERPKLVLLDIMMPGKLDGLGVLDAVKADPGLKDICVVMLTALSQAAHYKESMARGADGYITKPFSPVQLLAFVREQLGWRSHSASNGSAALRASGGYCQY